MSENSKLSRAGGFLALLLSVQLGVAPLSYAADTGEAGNASSPTSAGGTGAPDSGTASSAAGSSATGSNNPSSSTPGSSTAGSSTASSSASGSTTAAPSGGTPSWWKDGNEGAANPAVQSSPGGQSPDAARPSQKLQSETPRFAPHPPISPSARPAAQASAKPFTLYGRIEQISSGYGATLPLKLQEQKPMLDPRGARPLKGTAAAQQQRPLTGTVLQSWPRDWAGVWSGNSKIWSSQFDRIRWEFDPDEATKEQQLLRPGLNGNVSFNFSQSGSKIALEPTRIFFTTTMDQSQYSQMIDQMGRGGGGMNGMNGMFGGGSGGLGALINPQMMSQMMKSMPYMYAVHLGDLRAGTGVTGNQLNSRLVRNDVRELAPNVLEQIVVTYDDDTNAKTGRTRHSYSETCLRFTKQTNDQLYVQAATVKYNQDGRFEDKVVFYGTVTRGQPAYNPYQQIPTSFPGMQNMRQLPGFGGGGGSGGGSGLPGFPGGAGGLQGLDQLIRQLQGQ